MEDQLRESGGGVSQSDRDGALRSALATEFAGWLGAVALLLSFGLAAANLVKPASVPYLVLNLLGAIGLVHASLSRRAYSPALLNLIWAAIAAFSLALLFLRT